MTMSQLEKSKVKSPPSTQSVQVKPATHGSNLNVSDEGATIIIIDWIHITISATNAVDTAIAVTVFLLILLINNAVVITS